MQSLYSFFRQSIDQSTVCTAFVKVNRLMNSNKKKHFSIKNAISYEYNIQTLYRWCEKCEMYIYNFLSDAYILRIYIQNEWKIFNFLLYIYLFHILDSSHSLIFSSQWEWLLSDLGVCETAHNLSSFVYSYF